jgi:hypothetical protein
VWILVIQGRAEIGMAQCMVVISFIAAMAHLHVEVTSGLVCIEATKERTAMVQCRVDKIMIPSVQKIAIGDR